MDKYDWEMFFEYLWKIINFFYAIFLIASFFVGLNILLYVLGIMTDEDLSISGLIKVFSFLVVYIVIRNLTKPFFLKKMNKIQ